MPRRLKAHAQGKGAKYTRGRGPLKLIHAEAHRSRSLALKREAAVKAMSRAEKIKLFSKRRA
jgi:putative endonuclease